MKGAHVLLLLLFLGSLCGYHIHTVKTIGQETRIRDEKTISYKRENASMRQESADIRQETYRTVDSMTRNTRVLQKENVNIETLLNQQRNEGFRPLIHRSVDRPGHRIARTNTTEEGRAYGVLRQSADSSKAVVYADTTTSNVPFSATSSECVLIVSEQSAEMFKNLVLNHKFNILTFKLKFNTNVTAIPEIILPNQWTWVYKGTKGTKGTLMYITWSPAIKIWSLLLLYTHSIHDPIVLDISPAPFSNCSDLVIGHSTTDILIGNALGNMTHSVLGQDTTYKYSYWCYRKLQHANTTLFVDQFSHLLIPIYRRGTSVCCRQKYTLANRSVECGLNYSKDGYYYLLPVILGMIMYAYFPLLLLHYAGKIYRNTSGPLARMQAANAANYVLLTDTSPVTIFTTVFLFCKLSNIVSRLFRFIFPFITLFLVCVEVILYYLYLYEYTLDQVRAGDTTIGFPSMIAGIKKSKNANLALFGGPIVALTLYLILAIFIMCVPADIATLLNQGLALDGGSSRPLCLLNMRTQRKEKLSSIRIIQPENDDNCDNGYETTFSVLLANVYMLLNYMFWIDAFTVIKRRWEVCVRLFNTRRKCLRILKYPLFILVFVCHLICSLLELMFTFIYFAFPVIGSVVIVFRAFINSTQLYCVSTSAAATIDTVIRPANRLLGYFCCVFVGIILLYFLCIFGLVFSDEYVFLTRVFVFTYTAIVIYPAECYGYIMLAILSMYYLVRGVVDFGVLYMSILKVALKTCDGNDRFREYLHEIDGKCGIDKDLFEFLIENIKPRRIHLLHTILKFLVVVFVIAISISQIKTFINPEELSIVVHVLSVIFICALPMLFKRLTGRKHHKRLKERTNQLITKWHDDRNSCGNSSESS